MNITVHELNSWFGSKQHIQYYLNAMSVNLLHCSHSDQTRTSLVHCLQFHLRLEAVGCTLETGDD